ncbi:hypothetical protein JKP88DRAFT_157553 [Tribonema minus]|uniref:Uncharacterized protein n=1 Tax=Tribonema minus TaxID=303371 RepID=A0A835YYG1_9STRA|nr:hypothetical protein JKP88DRAFT_157553 [Tribonema minus]
MTERNAAAARPATEAARSERLRELLTALGREGVPLRDDSSLCRCFVEGTLSPPMGADEVARTCALHRFLYECTDYEARCRLNLPVMAASLAPSLGSWAAAWCYVKANEAPAIKAAALAAAGGIPDTWPWLSHHRKWQRRESGEGGD